MRDQRFRDYVEARDLFRGAACATGEDIIARCKEALREATVEMVRLGGREARLGKYDKGAALDWSRLTFLDRKKAMEDILRDALLQRKVAEEHKGHVLIRVAGRVVLMVPAGIPAAMTVPAAREMVGQPFLFDHQSQTFSKIKALALSM